MPQISDTPSDSVRERRVADSLIPAILLAFTGGGIDAFVFLNHGHVFAAAMTGNAVFLGIAVLAHDRHEVILHTLPFIAFVTGIWVSKFLAGHLRYHAITIGLLCEILVLFAASWLPSSFPEVFFVMIIAFAASYQVSSLRTVDTFAYNSTFITGNLRTAIDGLYDTLNPVTRRQGFHQCRDLSFVILSFALGAFAGAILAPRLLNHTLWILDLPLLAVLVTILYTRPEKRAGPSGPAHS
jgi:uncharacterized membrane protein YoaK (UPF0700 family)